MNPAPLLYWAVGAAVLGLVPWLAFGWSWWASLLAGLVLVPPVSWSIGALLDRYENPPGTGVLAQPEAFEPGSEFEIEPAPACPRCGGAESATVLYGLPAMSEALKQAITDKRVVLAGCLVYAGAPRWICGQCGEKHGRAEPGRDPIDAAAPAFPD